MSDCKQETRFAIVVVDFNGRDDTRKCLESLRTSDLRGALVVVVDNGSQPENASAHRAENGWATIIRNEQNGGWAGGNNTGIREALARGAEWVVLLNNDTVVAADFVPRLAAAISGNPRWGIIGPVIQYMDEPGAVMTDGVIFNPTGRPGEFFARREVPIERQDPPRVLPVDIVNGCCMAVSARVFERIGLVDERFFLIHEESDLCLRALQAGFECGVLAEGLVWHKGSSSFKRSGLRLQRYYDARNLMLLLRNHAASHRRGRSVLRSWVEYFKYLHYRHSTELEAGEKDSARAVIEGVSDAFSGRWGPYQPRRRATFGAWSTLFATLHRLRGGEPTATR